MAIERREVSATAWVNLETTFRMTHPSTRRHIYIPICWQSLELFGRELLASIVTKKRHCGNDSHYWLRAQFMLIPFVLSYLGLPVILSCKYYPHFTAEETEDREQSSDTSDVMLLQFGLELVPLMPLVRGPPAGAWHTCTK